MSNLPTPISRKEFLDLSAKSDLQHQQVCERIDKLISKSEELMLITHVGLKALYLVPVTFGFISITGTFLWYDKIPVWLWFLMNLVLMTPFYEHAVRLIMQIFPKIGGRNILANGNVGGKYT